MPATPDHPRCSADPAQPTPLPCRLALGFDFGSVRIGVAVGEAVTGSARPLGILPVHRQQPDWIAIARLIQDWHPDQLVVGVPRHADDSANAVTEAALQFSQQLSDRFHLPVATIDERLSSWEAEQRWFEQAAARQRRGTAPPRLDAQAAAVILESWFNQQRSIQHG